MSQVETDQYHPTLLAALHARTYRESSLLRLSGMISVWVGKLLVSLSDVGSRWRADSRHYCLNNDYGFGV
jgi:hypothetical protein